MDPMIEVNYVVEYCSWFLSFSKYIIIERKHLQTTHTYISTNMFICIFDL